jgi:large subunit ribosomal protein L24
VSIESGDPDVLTAWLQGRSDGTYRNQKPLRLRGDAVIAADRIGLDGMKAEINGGKIDGSIALLTTADNKTRLEAVLSAPSLDVESVSSLVSVLAGPQSAWPDEAQIALDAERAVVAGQEVRPVGFTLSYGSKAIALSGFRSAMPEAILPLPVRARLIVSTARAGSLDAAAPSLARVGAMVAPFAPAIAQRLNGLDVLGAVKTKLSAEFVQERARTNVRAAFDIDASQMKGALTLSAAPEMNIATGLNLAALSGANSAPA